MRKGGKQNSRPTKTLRKNDHEIGKTAWGNLSLQTSSLSGTNWMIQQRNYLSTKWIKIC